MPYRVKIIVEEVRGHCALGYRPGDSFVIEKYYIPRGDHPPICIHALNAMLTLLLPFIKGVSAKTLGIGDRDDIGYIQCPDPGKPYTRGGTVIFKLIREEID